MKKIKSFLSGLAMFAIILVSVGLWVVLPWQGLLALLLILVLWMALTRMGRQAAAVTWVLPRVIGGQ